MGKRKYDYGDDSEKHLWRIARKRAAFKRNLASYVLVNTILILIWLLTSGFKFSWGGFWPAWVLLGWGLGLLFNYRDAYDDKFSTFQRELDLLEDERGGGPVSDEELMAMERKARKRAEYRQNLFSYVVVNSFLMAIWLFTVLASGHWQFFWPIFPILGWGIGIFKNYQDAYRRSGVNDVDAEYERMRRDTGARSRKETAEEQTEEEPTQRR